MKYLILLLLVSCATVPQIKVVEKEPIFKNRQEIRELCFKTMFKMGITVEEAIQVCKFTLEK